MRLFQFIALDDPKDSLDIKKYENGIWTEDRSTIDIAASSTMARALSKTPAIVTVDVPDSAIDWVATRAFREESPSKKEIKLYPDQPVTVIDVNDAWPFAG